MTAIVDINDLSDEETDEAFLSAEDNPDHSQSEDSQDGESGDEDVSDNDTSTNDNSDANEESVESDSEDEDKGSGEHIKTLEDNTESGSNDESENEADSKDGGSGDEDVNVGWADAMSKILKTNKPKKKKTLVLSRAKKIADVKKVAKKGDPGFEVVGDEKEEKPSLDQLIKTEDDDGEPKSKKRREELPNLRIKPNILEKGREKILSKIATRGVVQLFNAVRKQQKDIESKIEKVGPLERKKEKVIKSLDKHKFLDMLMGQTKSEVVNKELMKKEVKDEESTWSVFRNDFMSGAKMKDWDKKDKETADDDKLSELSDSDSD